MNNRSPFQRALGFMLASAMLACAPLRAAEPVPEAAVNGDALLTTLVSLIQTLVDQGVLSASKARDMLRQAGVDPGLLSSAPPPAPAATTPPAVRVPYLPQTVKDELHDQLKQDVLTKARDERWIEQGAVPSWVSRVRWYGDVRFRIEREDYAADNAAAADVDNYYQLIPGTTLSTTHSRNRPRVRARLGMEATLDDNFSANVMLLTTTGDDATASPLSFNADQGRYGRPFSAGIELANLQWSPYAVLQVTGGRMNNPYIAPGGSTIAPDLVWARDLALDGVAVGFRPRFTNAWSGFLVAGAHPLQQSQLGPYNTAQQQWLYAGQTGIAFLGGDESTFRLGASYYSFVGIQGQLNPATPPSNTLNSLSVPLFRQRGNTMFDINTLSNPGTPAWAIASQFKELELGASFEFARYDPLRFAVDVDAVRNVGFKAAQISTQLGAAALALPVDKTGANGIQRPRVNGYQFALLAGEHEVRTLRDWQVFGGYRYLERDAMVDGFTSSDYRLGGTDVRGPFGGVSFGLGERVSATLRYNAAKNIDAVPNFEVNTWFLDFLGRF